MKTAGCGTEGTGRDTDRGGTSGLRAHEEESPRDKCHGSDSPDLAMICDSPVAVTAFELPRSSNAPG